MNSEHASVSTTFDRARQQRAYRRLARVVSGQDGADLLPLDEATERLRPFRRRYVGLRVIPLQQVVGTDSRGGDFDRHFLPRRPGDVYFVIDGQNRVAIARQPGMERSTRR